jgi:predicted N-acetyltransferase YhbS
MKTHENDQAPIVVRPLREADLTAADHVMRVAFGTLLGVPEPSAMFGDASWVRNRWQADPGAAFAAEQEGEIVGSGFATRWGSFGFLGPITVRPDVWDRGIGRRLTEALVSLLSQWEVRLAGLFTGPQSPKHLGLYQKFGFRPRYLTAVMSKPVQSARPALPWELYSQLSESERRACLRDCRRITDSLFDGLDLTSEIRAIAAQDLGDTVLLRQDSGLVAFAACHQGAQTEAGSGTCYVKFAAAQPGDATARRFETLLAACESFAAPKGARRLVAGVNTARQEAYERMLQDGFRTDVLGIAMHRPNEPGFSRKGVYVLDDWR